MWRQVIAAFGMAAVVGGISVVAQADPSAQQKPPSQQAQDTSSAQANDSTATITFVGCLIRESDYRRAHALGKGGIAGIRTGSDFVLVDAKAAPAAATSSTSTDSSKPAAIAAGTSAPCSETGTGEAYRLAGKTEGELKPFVGRYIEITGHFEHARDARIAGGEKSARLPAEIVVASYRQAATPQSAPIATATTGQTPAPPSPPAATPAPAATPVQAAREQLPHTASDEPMLALVGLLSMSAAIALALVRRRIA